MLTDPNGQSVSRVQRHRGMDDATQLPPIVCGKRVDSSHCDFSDRCYNKAELLMVPHIRANASQYSLLPTCRVIQAQDQATFLSLSSPLWQDWQVCRRTFLHLVNVLKVSGLRSNNTWAVPKNGAPRLRLPTVTENRALCCHYFVIQFVRTPSNTKTPCLVQHMDRSPFQLIPLVIGILRRRRVWDEVTTMNSSKTLCVQCANHESYPNEPRPPQPCLGVSLRAVRPSVPDRRMSTLITFCRSIEHSIKM